MPQADTHSTTFSPFCRWFGRLSPALLFPPGLVPEMTGGWLGQALPSTAPAARCDTGPCTFLEDFGPTTTTVAVQAPTLPPFPGQSITLFSWGFRVLKQTLHAVTNAVHSKRCYSTTRRPFNPDHYRACWLPTTALPPLSQTRAKSPTPEADSAVPSRKLGMRGEMLSLLLTGAMEASPRGSPEAR